MRTKKLKKQIKVDKTIAQIIYAPDDDSINWAGKMLLKSLKKLKAFYKTNLPAIKLELIYSRNEFNGKLGRSTPDWMAGVTLKNTICLFSPLVVEKESSHNQTDLNKIFTHELYHIFNNKINKQILTWVDEGTALFLAGQKKNKDFKKMEWDYFIDNFLTKNIDLTTFAKYNGYKISYWLIKILNQRLGKEKLLNLIKITDKNEDYERELIKITGLTKKDFKEFI